MYDHVIEDCSSRMEKTITALHYTFNNIRTGRANPKLLDSIRIDYYGVDTPLTQIAGVSAPEARLLLISPWDVKALPQIERAILQSDLGLNPSNDGKVIRLAIPELNEERRKDLSKLARKESEDSKVAIRNIRKDGMDQFKKMEKNKEITEDDLRIASDKLQKTVDDFIKKIDEVLEKKITEIMQV
ncbi:MAG: ribosome recycling factor [Christensenellaceae bacterium]|nr:ribosome recycling factor [Christensenellaceae bacterium]